MYKKLTKTTIIVVAVDWQKDGGHSNMNIE
jgi:hypothetical protein